MKCAPSQYRFWWQISGSHYSSIRISVQGLRITENEGDIVGLKGVHFLSKLLNKIPRVWEESWIYTESSQRVHTGFKCYVFGYHDMYMQPSSSKPWMQRSSDTYVHVKRRTSNNNVDKNLNSGEDASIPTSEEETCVITFYLLVTQEPQCCFVFVHPKPVLKPPSQICLRCTKTKWIINPSTNSRN